MVTYKQIYYKIRQLKKKKNRKKLLDQCPQKKGICTRLFIMTPKKPNSAKRKVAKLRLPSIKKNTFGYIPGIGHTLQKFSHVLIRGGLIRDLPGIHYTMIRGKYDLRGIDVRRQARSKYGNKLWWKLKKKDRINAWKKFKKKIQLRIFERVSSKKFSRIRFIYTMASYFRKREKDPKVGKKFLLQRRKTFFDTKNNTTKKVFSKLLSKK